MNRLEILEGAIGRPVSRETMLDLERFEQLLLCENRRQNLISRNSEPELWLRHIVDSAQLLRFERGPHWLDVGSGAGLPGIILAILGAKRVTLVEPRRLRSEFLERMVGVLGLADRIELIPARVQKLSGSYDMITARAFAAPSEILRLTIRLAAPGAVWVLPRGRNGSSELAQLAATWQGEFRAEPSMTDAEATILVASSPRPRETQ